MSAIGRVQGEKVAHSASFASQLLVSFRLVFHILFALLFAILAILARLACLIGVHCLGKGKEPRKRRADVLYGDCGAKQDGRRVLNNSS